MEHHDAQTYRANGASARLSHLLGPVDGSEEIQGERPLTPVPPRSRPVVTEAVIRVIEWHRRHLQGR
jgi:hypothetical protein